MKFSDIQSKDWEQWKPYLDTCLLPLTGLNGGEQPWEATDRLEQLRDLLDCLEKPFHGRIVTYPAFHYAAGASGREALGACCAKLKESGFKYVIVATTCSDIAKWHIAEADLFIVKDAAEIRGNAAETKQEISQLVQRLWQAAG